MLMSLVGISYASEKTWQFKSSLLDNCGKKFSGSVYKNKYNVDSIVTLKSRPAVVKSYIDF